MTPDLAATVKRLRAAWLPVLLTPDIHEVLDELERVTGALVVYKKQFGEYP